MNNAAETRNVTLTMATGDMLNLLANSYPFVEKNSSHPVLEYVALTVEGGKVTALGTDRYRIGRVELPLIKVTSGPHGHEGPLLMHRKVAEQFTKALKTIGKRELTKRSDFAEPVDTEVSAAKLAKLTAVIAVTVAGEYVAEWRLDWAAGSSQASNELHSRLDFPSAGKLIPTSLPTSEEANGLLVFNPTLMASFLKVTDLTCKLNTPMAIIGGEKPGKPMVIQYDEWFTGLLMPVRLNAPGVRYGSAADRDAVSSAA